MKSWGHPLTELHEKQGRWRSKGKSLLYAKKFLGKIFKLCVQAYIFIDTNNQRNVFRGKGGGGVR